MSARPADSLTAAAPAGYTHAWIDVEVLYQQQQQQHEDISLHAVVQVRADQYVANVLPLTATKELRNFFRAILRSR
ncbi:hypothetical protein [Arthrobacter sp. H14-L1]|uniref:hypothetical protein n=1 Tax=Arthrobacter sp. H14-L1 TaxID=2996697 RepID=UPI002270BD67|nr:hypothetical protein [Arthrobacter sp. H14-L1]MCY0905134.1 hypothetical protein [Arthrobacter sp. H14-L1]